MVEIVNKKKYIFFLQMYNLGPKHNIIYTDIIHPFNLKKKSNNGM